MLDARWLGVLTLSAFLGGGAVAQSPPKAFDGGASPGVASSRAALLRARSGAQDASYSVLHRFTGADGSGPFSGLTFARGALYGTTANGGLGNQGVVFEITTLGSQKVIYSFGVSNDGYYPYAKLLYAGGNLFGTTNAGGPGTSCFSNCGAVFEIGEYGMHPIYSFQGAPDGGKPFGALLSIDGQGYGTTGYGGNLGGNNFRFGNGTIYEVDLQGHETVLHAFSGPPTDGADPEAGLVETNGYLYGTTNAGGKTNNGTVFRINRSGYENVFSFNGKNGSQPAAELINVSGTLYGTTSAGGSFYSNRFLTGYGTVFEISPSGNEHVLYSFTGGADGYGPQARLINLKGILYGTTSGGGKTGNGTVFKIDPSTGTETVLHSFAGGADGSDPFSDLVNVNGLLYGTTRDGGNGAQCTLPYGCGTVFAISP